MRENSKGASRLFTTRIRTRPDQSMQHAMLEFAAELHPARKRNDAPIRARPQVTVSVSILPPVEPFRSQNGRDTLPPANERVSAVKDRLVYKKGRLDL
jgi:hypothetical protein